MTIRRQLMALAALTMTLGLTNQVTADPAYDQYVAIDKLVKESGVIKVLAAQRPQKSDGIQFLVLAEPKRYAPRLLLSDTGVLWISLPDMQNRTPLSPGDLFRYNFTFDAVKSGIEAVQKQANVFIDMRRKNDLPAGSGAPYVEPFTWRSPSSLKETKGKPVIAGRENGLDLAVCRGHHSNGKHPGKAIGDKCYYGFGGKELATTEFDYLVDEGGLTWQTVASSDLPKKQAPAGYEPGTNLPVCRGAHQGATHPGKVYGGKCHIGFAGQEVPIATFETLAR